MPAKGQDMPTSLFLARLIGPFALAIGVALVFNRTGFRALANEFLASPALLFFSGAVTMPAGLAIVITHSVWTTDWRVIITILGWLATIGGAVRMICPKLTATMGHRMLAYPFTLHVSAAIYLVVGALLCIFGYRH
jgi:hypothetical protein